MLLTIEGRLILRVAPSIVTSVLPLDAESTVVKVYC